MQSVVAEHRTDVSSGSVRGDGSNLRGTIPERNDDRRIEPVLIGRPAGDGTATGRINVAGVVGGVAAAASQCGGRTGQLG